MEKNILPPAAAILFDRGCIVFLLWVLMIFSTDMTLLYIIFSGSLALCLSLMVYEDAFEQTVDLIMLCLLATVMFLISVFSGQTSTFLLHSVIGICFFRFLLVALSLFLTCRSGSVAVPSDAWINNDDVLHDNACPVGFLPIFMIVFAIYLGFGEQLFPFVYTQAAFIVDTIADLVDYFPFFVYLAIILWLLMELKLWWMEHKENRHILWAFGGGDVIFLGLFSGHLGLSILFALFFLSLIARVIFFLLQLWLDKTTSITSN